MIDLVRLFLVANLFTLLPYADEMKTEQVEVNAIFNMYMGKSGELLIEAQVTYHNSCYHPLSQQVSVVDEEETIFLYHFAEKSQGMCALAMFDQTVTFVIAQEDVKSYRYRDGLTGKILREKETQLSRAH